jgi:hypothetical protein
MKLNQLILEYTTLTDTDDDILYSIKYKLRQLDLPDLRLFVTWIDQNQNYASTSRYFNTTVYFTKKRINKIKEILCL